MARKETTEMSIEDKEAEGLFCSPHISADFNPIRKVPGFRRPLSCSATLKGSLNIWRFHLILRSNRSFHTSLLFSTINLISCF